MTGNPSGPMNLAENPLPRSHAHGRRHARRWTNVVNASPEVQGIEWHYLLLAERDVNDAQGSWEQMKGFGR